MQSFLGSSNQRVPSGSPAWVSALINSHCPKLVRTLIPSTLPSLHLAIHKPFHTRALILTGILLTTPCRHQGHACDIAGTRAQHPGLLTLCSFPISLGVNKNFTLGKNMSHKGLQWLHSFKNGMPKVLSLDSRRDLELVLHRATCVNTEREDAPQPSSLRWVTQGNELLKENKYQEVGRTAQRILNELRKHLTQELLVQPLTKLSNPIW